MIDTSVIVLATININVGESASEKSTAEMRLQALERWRIEIEEQLDALRKDSR